MSTVTEMTRIAEDTLLWVKHPQPNVTDDYRRKIELLSKTVIEYGRLLNTVAAMGVLPE